MCQRFESRSFKYILTTTSIQLNKQKNVAQKLSFGFFF